MLESTGLAPSKGASPDAAAGPARVTIRNLSKVYRTRRGAHVALDDVSLEIGGSEFVVLLGPSGCGKTTLLRCVAGLEEPDAGEIYINDQLVFSSEKGVFVPPEKRQFNMVFQSYALWPHMTVSENAEYPLRNSGHNSRTARQKAAEALHMVGLGDYLHAYPGQLSGGQQQRVALARAIVSGDGLILFDEPLSNLDAKVRDRLRLELLSLQAKIGFAAIYVTHDQVEALALADRIAVMDVGRIAQVGSPREIYDAPISRYTADFVGSANELPGTVVRNDGRMTIDTPIGQIDSLTSATGMVAGSKVWVMFRPENCHLSPEPAADGRNQFQGQLSRSFYLGSSTQSVVTCGEHQIIVSGTGRSLPATGTQVNVTCAPEHFHVFSADADR